MRRTTRAWVARRGRRNSLVGHRRVRKDRVAQARLPANRDRVRTNSYYQVAEAVHGRSAGRWLRYRAHLEPHLARLRPHAEALGYPLD